MIEVIYKEDRKGDGEKAEFIQIPKNIRQIGLPGGYYKIYMEDYVNTFLKKLSDEIQNGGRTALLLGQVEYLEGVTYIFIRCALGIQQEVSIEHLPFEEKLWTELNREMEETFPGQEVVGWFFTASVLEENVENQLCKTHITHFGGEKVLFVMDAQEREEAFFRYDQGKLNQQQGYYIYYEKNPEMQSYLIAQSKNQSMESEEIVQDQAVKSFRKKNPGKTEEKVQREKKEEEEEKKAKGWGYSVAAAAVVAITLTVGGHYLNHYEQIQNVGEETMETAAHVFSEKNQGQETILESPSAAPEETIRSTVTPQVRLTVSPKAEGKETPELSESTNAGGLKTYQIQSGDTLNKICMKIYGNLDYVDRICEMNQITEAETIYPGEIIILP